MAGASERFGTIKYEVDDRVARVTLNRPEKMNALSRELQADVRDALTAADADDAVRVIVLGGAGGRAFSSGYDMGGDPSEKAPKSARAMSDVIDDALTFTYSVWDCSKPVIAMIDGYCLGGGLELALMCDIRYASSDSRLAVIEARFGSVLATLVLPWIIGSRSREVMYMGDMIDAADAARLGLVDRVFPKDQLEAQTMKIAKRMSRVALEYLRYSKRALNQTLDLQGFRLALTAGTQAAAIQMSIGSAEGRTFHEISQRDGLKAALDWRKSLFAPYE